jgi:hypothetical protein
MVTVADAGVESRTRRCRTPGQWLECAGVVRAPASVAETGAL